MPRAWRAQGDQRRVPQDRANRVGKKMRVTRTPQTTSTPVATPSPLTNRRRRMAAEREVEVVQAQQEDVVECPVDENFLSAIIDRAPRTVRPMRPGEYLHVSDLLGKCVRKIVLAARHSSPLRPQRLSISDELAFAQGDAIHDRVKAMATASSPVRVWGRWSCKCENLYHEEPCTYSETDPNDICEMCGTPTNVYQEVPMRDDDTMIVGTPDLLFYLADLDAFHVTEIKSMAENAWQEMVRPKPEHVLQVLFYWYLMRKLGYRMTDQVSIFYVTKNYKFVGKPYKEYMFYPEHELHRLDIYLSDAYATKASRTDPDAALPSRVCSSENTVDARKCEVCQICFSRD